MCQEMQGSAGPIKPPEAPAMACRCSRRSIEGARTSCRPPAGSRAMHCLVAGVLSSAEVIRYAPVYCSSVLPA